MYTIIVVDDEEELRHAIIKRVEWEKIGFEVVGEAGNGIDALELVEQLEPDLLLTDIRMPFMSGIELARQVREVRPATQIAFLSGYDDFAYAQQAIQYNIISYLLKPISMADLTAELLEIRKKLDHLFEELQAKQKEQTNLNDFVTTLDVYKRQDVRWYLVLSGSSKCALDIPVWSFRYPSDGTGAQERKNLGRSAGVGDRCDSRIDTGNPLYGRLLWCRCCNGICVLFLSWP